MRKLPTNVDAYIKMVRDALFEVGNLRAAIGYEEDDLAETAGEFLDALEGGLQTLLKGLEAGSHVFADGADLPFMQHIAGASSYVLPFRTLIEDVNATHRQGLSP